MGWNRAYLRISEDRKGEGAGVERQLEDVVALAHQHGLEFDDEDVHVDNDVSAFSGKHRPEYERLMRDVRAGQVRVVLVYMTSRLWRNRRERAEGTEVFAAHRIRVVAVKGPELDFSSAVGRMVADVVGAMDTVESEIKSERQVRAIRQQAEKGGVHGGPRPYGFQADRITHDKQEAAIVREVYRRLLDGGESLNSIARDLNVRGNLGATGRPWQTSTLTRLLLSPRMAGFRVHRPQAERNGRGGGRLGEGDVLYPAIWKPVVDRETWQRARDLLLAPGRRRPTAGRHLLAGLLRCAECGQPMRSQPVRGIAYYVCMAQYGVGRASYVAPEQRLGCGGRRVQKLLTEEHVVAHALGRLAQPSERRRIERAAHASQEDTDRLAQQVEETQAEQRALGKLYAARGISLTAFAAADAELQRSIAEAQSQLALRSRAVALPPATSAADLATWWESADVTARKALLSVVFEQVQVHPSMVKGGRAWRPEERLELVWR